jgi:hypothetical protein
MGIYSHISTEDLTAKRSRLVDALELRLTTPSRVASGTHAAEYQQVSEQIRKEIGGINSELERRGASGSLSGSNARSPIYLV